jgi:peroxiredoxin
VQPITVGAQAPEFELKDQDGTTHSLMSLRGRSVLLSFHPLAWTGVCQRQMEALEMNAERFEALGVQVFGISVDTVPSKKAWAESIGVKKTRLLSDFWPHGEVAKSLGIFRETEGVSERANMIVDASGTVQWVKVYPIGEVPDLPAVFEILDSLRAA